MKKRDWWNKEFKWLVAIGESITAGGWSSCRERAWPSLLTRTINDLQRVPVQLINAGIGANVVSTKSGGYVHSSKPCLADRIDTHIPSTTANGHPVETDLLIISYGLNDARGGTSVELFCSEMEEIIGRIRKRIQPLIVLVGPYHMVDFKIGGPDWQHADMAMVERYNEATKKLAEKLDCLFVDLLASYQKADWLVHGDGIHGNDIGHRIVANKIFEVLAGNCSGLALETKALEKWPLRGATNQRFNNNFNEINITEFNTGITSSSHRK